MQVIAAGNDELRLLSLALAIEQVIGAPARPDLAPFLAHHDAGASTTAAPA
jgi:hypothetical protein